MEIFQKTNNSELEIKLVFECAPLLSGLRPANIINISRNEFQNLRHLLNGTDISFYRLSSTKDKISVLLYRYSMLIEYFNQSGVKKLLHKLGYRAEDIYGLLYLFSMRYKNYVEGKGDFPHEMGVFLGYPIEDVIGFIDNNGKNFLCIGYWKVYKDVGQKKRLFQNFEKSKEIMMKLVLYGLNVKEIIMYFNDNKVFAY